MAERVRPAALAAGAAPALTAPYEVRRPGPIERLAEVGRREAPRRLLWLPVALGIGIGSYFALPFEPSPFVGPAAVVASAALALLLRRDAFAVWLAVLLLATAIGFTAGEIRTLTTSTTMLQQEIWADVEGRVTMIERRPGDWRLTLTAVTIDASGGTPSGIRVTVAGRKQDEVRDRLRIGDRVRLRARLRPPAPPVAPGAYDFQRDAFFRGIGATGIAVGSVQIVEPVATGAVETVRIVVDRIRDAVAGRIRASLPGPTGAVAAAMLVGDRAGIDEATNEAFRETGLAHLLSISGLHMGLVAGTVFAAVRLALAAWPAIALRRPIKKWAAVAALVAAVLYLLLAGAPVPTQRSFLMASVVLAGVLLDREAVSLHLVAWAAAVVLLLSPESLVGPSFQLSFAAVIGLITLWEEIGRRRRTLLVDGRRSVLWRAIGYVAGVAATSAVASLATAPIVAFHFQQVPILGAVANLLAVPVTAFVTMPAGIAALALMPVGLETWPLALMGLGLDATLWSADWASEGPLTSAAVPALGVAPLALLASGGLWLVVWQTRLRWLGGFLLAAGLAFWAFEQPPDALISADGELAAVHVPGIGWAVSRNRGNRFILDAWRQRWGGAGAGSFLAADAREAEALSCDGLGCVLRVGARILALPSSPEAAVEDCSNADVVIAPFRLRTACTGHAVVIDRMALRRDGAHAVWLGTDRVRVRSVNNARGRRPWVVRQSH